MVVGAKNRRILRENASESLDTHRIDEGGEPKEQARPVEAL